MEKNKEKEEKRKPENECREQTVHAARTPSVTVQWLGEVNAERGSEGSNPTRPSGPVGHPRCGSLSRQSRRELPTLPEQNVASRQLRIHEESEETL